MFVILSQGFGGSYFDPTFDRRTSANTLTTVLIVYSVADPVYVLALLTCSLILYLGSG